MEEFLLLDFKLTIFKLYSTFLLCDLAKCQSFYQTTKTKRLAQVSQHASEYSNNMLIKQKPPLSPK